MTKNRTGRLARLLLPAAALFALAGALLVPAEAGLASSSAAAPRARRARQEEARAPEKERPAESTVRGRVVYDDTERPVRRAQITLLGETGDRTEFGALTDARGYFTIRKVRAGTYVVAVGVPGVISPTGFMTFDELRAPGLPDFGEGRKFFDVVEVNGKEDATVTVHARRGAALSGRVTYADGDPAPSVTVHIVRRDSEGRLRRLLPSGLSAFMLNRTDDRGQFRVAGLPPGEYYVSVTEAAVHGAESRGARPYGAPNVIEELAGQHFLVTYHPSASGVKEAESVKVAAGEERADVDVVIPERALRTVAGQVRSRRDGRPVARARVTIVRRDDASEETAALYYDTSRLSNNGTTTDEAGRFQFKEIPDGAYTVSVRPPEEFEEAAWASTNGNAHPPSYGTTNANADYGPRRRRKGFAPARRELDVSGEVSDFAVEVSEGARVAGTVAVEGEASPTSYAYVNLVRAPEAGAPPRPSDVHNASVEGGRFAADGLPAGRFYVHASAYEEDRKTYLKSVTWKGHDLLREPLELAEGAAAEGVEIVFSRNPATLRVAVAAGGKPVRMAGVFLLPAADAGWRPFAGPQLFCWTGDDGSCDVAAPPGEYRVVALTQKVMRGGEGVAQIESEVRRRGTAAPHVSLRAGETKELEVVAQER